MHEAGFQCAGCGEWIETTVDESGGSKQQYVEDLPGLLPTERANRPMGYLSTGVHNPCRVGELAAAPAGILPASHGYNRDFPPGFVWA